MKIGKIILAAVSAIALCFLANSCLKNSAKEITYTLFNYNYTSTPKPEASDLLKKEITSLCSSSTGKDRMEVANSLQEIIDKYTTKDYKPFSYDITVTFDDGNSQGFISKSDSQ